MRLVFLVEVTAYDPTEDELVTLRMCSRGQGHVTFGDDREFIPCIVTPPTQTKSFNENGIPGEISIDYGSLVVGFSDELRNGHWRSFDFDSYPARMWWGEYGAPFETYKPIPAGRVGSLNLSSAVQGELAILGPDVELRQSLLSKSYAGTGGAEGTEDLKGTLKPFRIGLCENIDVLLIDPVNLIYQYHGYGPTNDVLAVYENALTLGEAKLVASSYEELAGYSDTELPPGTWAKCPAEGMFRLGAEPTGKFTADVIGATEDGNTPRTVGAICSYVLRHHAGISADRIDEASAAAMDASLPHSWGDGVDAQRASEDEEDADDPDTTAEFSVGEFVRTACSHIAGYLFADANGIWRFGRNVSNKEPLTLQQTDVTSISMPATSTRVWKVRVGGRRCFSVHSESEISSALKDAIDEAVTGANDASDKADAANDNANNIRSGLPELVLPVLQQPIDDLTALQLENSNVIMKAQAALHKLNQVAIQQLSLRVDENGSLVSEQYTQLTSRIDEQDKTIEAGFLEVDQTIAGLDYATAESVQDMIANYGEDVTAAMNEEQRVRSEKDAALAEGIDQMGVKITQEGTTRQGQINEVKQLIIDAGDNSALAQTVEELGVKIEDEKSARESAIRTEEQARTTADTTLTKRADTLSSSIDAINGLIETIERTEATNNAARATETKNLQARLDNQNGSSIEQIFDTQADLNDKFRAAYTVKVQTEVNGVKVFGGFGIVAEDGVVDTAFATDAFRLYTSKGAKQVFYADDNGVLIDNAAIKNLSADNLLVGGVTTEAIAEAAANKTTIAETTGTISVPRYSTTTILTVTARKDRADSLMKLLGYLTISSPDDITVNAYLYRGSTLLKSSPFYLIGSGSQMKTTLVVHDCEDGLAPGSYTYTLKLYNSEGDASSISVLSGALLEATEVKR